jgi:hypothetical protein
MANDRLEEKAKHRDIFHQRPRALVQSCGLRTHIGGSSKQNAKDRGFNERGVLNSLIAALLRARPVANPAPT